MGTAPSAFVSRGFIVLAAVLWSTGGAAIKLADLGAGQIAGGRSFVTAVFFGVLWLGQPRQAKVSWPTMGLAVTCYALTNILFVYANTKTTAGAAIFLQNIAPIWVLLLGPWFLRERPSRIELLSVPISLFGSGLFFAGQLDATAVRGNLAAVSASLSYGLLIMSYRKLDGGGIAATGLGSVLTFTLTLPFLFDAPVPSWRSLLALVYLGAVQQGLAALAFIRGIRGVSAIEAALLILLEPLLSPLWAYLSVGEHMSPTALLGGALIVGAAIVRTGLRPRAQVEPNPR